MSKQKEQNHKNLCRLGIILCIISLFLSYFITQNTKSDNYFLYIKSTLLLDLGLILIFFSIVRFIGYHFGLKQKHWISRLYFYGNYICVFCFLFTFIISDLISRYMPRRYFRYKDDPPSMLFEFLQSHELHTFLASTMTLSSLIFLIIQAIVMLELVVETVKKGKVGNLEEIKKLRG